MFYMLYFINSTNSIMFIGHCTQLRSKPFFSRNVSKRDSFLVNNAHFSLSLYLSVCACFSSFQVKAVNVLRTETVNSIAAIALVHFGWHRFIAPFVFRIINLPLIIIVAVVSFLRHIRATLHNAQTHHLRKYIRHTYIQKGCNCT